MSTFTDSSRGGDTDTGVNVFTPSTISQVPLTIDLLAGQTANAFRVRNSAGTVLFSIDPSGNVSWQGSSTVVVNETVTGNSSITGTLSVTGASTLTGAVSLASSLSVTGASTLTGDVVANHNLTVNNNFIGNGYTYFNNVVTITSAGASALTVGRQGATSPALKIDASVASSVTGMEIVSAAAAAGVNLRAISSGTNENLTFNAKGSGTIVLGDVSTGAITLTRAASCSSTLACSSTVTVTSADASALAVGRLGATTPALKVDASAATAVTGMEIVSAAAAGGVNLRAISSGAAENLTINAKGTGTITLGDVSTGAITLTRATSCSSTLAVTSTSTLTGAVTCTAGCQSTAVAVTATVDGLTTGIIPAGARYVTATAGADANSIVTLPTPVVGNIITMYIGTTGCEVRTVAASNVKINDVDSDGTNEVAIPAQTLCTFTCVSATEWTLEATTKLGATLTALLPDAA